MEKRRLGNTDLELTVIGLGTWAIGGGEWDFGWGPQEEADSIETIVEAIELGVNWIDTAAIYGVGKSEEAVGKAIRRSGKNVIVATKCGLHGDDKGHVKRELSGPSIRKEVDDSLRRLQVDVIDLYQIHWPVPDNKIEEAFETLQILKEKHKIRWAGVSNFSAEQLQRISTIAPVSSLQPPYSILNRNIEDDILPWCRKHGTGVIAYSPMQCGLLTGKVTKDWVAALPDNDFRKSKNIYFQEPRLSAGIRAVHELKEIAEAHNKSVAQLAIAWVNAQEGVTASIVGARRRGQFAEVIEAGNWKLDQRTVDQIRSVSEQYQREVAG